MTAPTETERRLEASISLATIRNALLDLARELTDADADALADEARRIDRLVRQFGEQARELANPRARA